MHHLWGPTEIDALLKEHDLAKADADGEERTEAAVGNAGYAENKPEV